MSNECMDFSGAKIVGLISDTHGLLRPEALDALKGCDLVIHAGDIGGPNILDALQQIAPVVAIKGNVDKASQYPATVLIQAGRARVFVIHDVHDIAFHPEASDVNVVVSGHSHKPGQHRVRDILYVNPGSAGRRRFRLPVTVARLYVGTLPCRAEIMEIAP